MIAPEPTPAQAGACPRCLRRSWLLSALSGPLDRRCGDRSRLYELLELPDADLLKALAGRRREELVIAYRRRSPADTPHDPGTGSVCRHRRAYPPGLTGSGTAVTLFFTGGTERFSALSHAPTVAILGGARASDYGIQTARAIARGLAAAGVTVAACLTSPIGAAAHRGALDVNAPALAITAGAPGGAGERRRRGLEASVHRSGCLVGELPAGHTARRWSVAACERIPVQLAGVTLVVEAGERQHELAAARLAPTLGRLLAAVPGRVSSPASSGSHLLLMQGASLVRGPADALELLLGPGAPRATATGVAANLPPPLRDALEQVALGHDNPASLTRTGSDHAALLLALSELELMGLLTRGDGGRYLPAQE